MVCFVRRSSIDYDIRLRKYVEACLETNVPYIAITWDRQKNSTNTYLNEFQYKIEAPYGGGLKNFIAIIGWLVFMYYKLLFNWRHYKIIHACNLETYIFVLPLKLLGKKIVFDIYDSMNVKLEKQIAKYADVLILPHRERLKQIGLEESDVERYMTIENVPKFEGNKIKKKEVEFPNLIHLSYVGILERNIRGLENMLEIVMSDNRFFLDIAGVGGGLESLVQKCQSKCERIRYFGKVDYVKALNIMANSDFIVAQYYPSHVLHKFASPNKYYESLYLSTPIITSEKTLVGEQVLKNNIGYVINDTKEAFVNIFNNVEEDSFYSEYKMKQKKCSLLWDSMYKSYFDNNIKGEYIKLIESL